MVHGRRPDLDLVAREERVARLHGRVQRLVPVGLGPADVVLDVAHVVLALLAGELVEHAVAEGRALLALGRDDDADADDVPETLCSLRFAARAHDVALGQAKKNVAPARAASPMGRPPRTPERR